MVRVFADPRTSTTSLEGGRLYTTDLRPMAPGEILPRTGGKQAFSIATAAGPIFVNPFKAAGPGRDLEINHTSGRVLGGGTVTRDIPVKLRLARPSHVLASLIERAINTRFPQEPGQRSRTAHGESEESIEIHVPPSYRDRTREFMQLVQHTTIQQMAAERVAINVRRVLEADPSAANDASWRWQALGARTIPIIRDLYDHPGEITRLAALRAGAGLDDPLIVPHLIDTARQGAKPIRLQAIRLLTDLRLNPQIDVALRPLLNDPDVDVRLGAYEALSDRGDPAIGRVNVEGKFVLEVVESDYPMIYVTQFGSPRVVLFGSDLALERPLTAQAWSNRLIVKEAGDGAQIEVFYRPPGARQPMIETISANLDQFIEYLAHTSTATAPEPGLGLSYGHTIGAIYQIYSQGYIKADFKAEQDRILAAIMDFQRESTVKERPEFADPDFDIIRPEAAPDGSTGSTTGGTMQPVPTAAAEQAPGASAAGPGRP